MRRRNSTLFLLGAVLLFSAMAYGFGGTSAYVVPRVEYVRPTDESVISLEDKDGIAFEWRRVPIPSGGRECYRITIIKEPGYDTVFDKTIDERTFSVKVPAGVFEPGMTYRWRVKQRDARTMFWSNYDLWYFKVKR